MLRILVVDDDVTSLVVAKACLMRWDHEVTGARHALEALTILGQRDENERPFDLVLSDVHMPVMDGFQLLTRVNADFNIPVVLISADDRTDVMCKGLRIGAPTFLVKPLKAEDARGMWQHPVAWKDRERVAWRRFIEASIPRINILPSPSSDSDTEDVPAQRLKGNHTVWNSNLHSRFVEVMLILGPKDSVPKSIVEAMNVPGLTREQVASHLQKFRKFLDKVLDGTTTLDQSRNKWIDRHYHSSIVGGNPNVILVNQLLEMRRTGRSPAPIKAPLPLPPYNEAEGSASRNIAMLMPHNFEPSFRNVATPTAGLEGVPFHSAANVATPAQRLRDLPSENAGNMTVENEMANYQNAVVPQQNHYFANGGLIGGASNNMLPSADLSAPSSGTAPISDNFIYDQAFNVSSQDSDVVIFFCENNFNPNLQVGNVQLHDPLDVIQFGDPFEINQQALELGGVQMDNQNLLISNNNEVRDESLFGFDPNLIQLGSVHLDPNTGSSSRGANDIGNASVMPMNEQAPQLDGKVPLGEGSCLMNNNTGANDMPAAENSLLGCDPNSDEDWSELFESLRNIGDDEYMEM